MYTPVPTRHMYMYISIKNLVNSTRFHEGFFGTFSFQCLALCFKCTTELQSNVFGPLFPYKVRLIVNGSHVGISKRLSRVRYHRF